MLQLPTGYLTMDKPRRRPAKVSSFDPIGAIDLGARWLAGLLLAAVIVAQAWMLLAR
ncbi:MAG: hypothetical protein ACYC5Y_05075 [Symbiobacteriia bacterium]